MNCDRVKSFLSAYLDQELSAEERRVIRQHLFSCGSCSQEYQALSNLKSSLGGLEPPALPDDLISRVLLFHNTNPFSQPTFATLSNPFLIGKKLLMTAACLGLFMVTSLWLFPSPQTTTLSTGSGRITSNRLENRVLQYSATTHNKIYAETDQEKSSDHDLNHNGLDDNNLEQNYLDQNYPLLLGIPVSH